VCSSDLEGGEVTLASALVEDGKMVELKVADNGPGLPDGDHEWVFGAGHSSHRQEGRGMGLASCRQLIIAAGGELMAAGQSGGGAVFSLTLPVARGADAVLYPQSDDAAMPQSVLVVDDEAAVREMLVDVFEAWGCETRAYRDAEAVLQDYTAGAAQVALIDKNLPGRSGEELATRLRNDDPCLGIILASGWQGAEGPPSDAKSVDFVTDKPLALPRLRLLIQQAYALEQRREKGQL